MKKNEKSKVKINLTKYEIDEFLLTTSFEKEDLMNLKTSFEQMQSNPEVVGKVSFLEFSRFLKLKDDSLLGKKLFDKLDINRDGYLTFIDLITSLDSMHQKQFKSKLKFYFELFCEREKKISSAKLLKMSKEVTSYFPHLVLPDDFVLENSKHSSNEEKQPPQKFNSSNSQDNIENGDEEEGVSLDDFFDHFENVFYSLV